MACACDATIVMLTIANARVDVLDAIPAIFRRFDPVLGPVELADQVQTLCQGFRVLAVAGLLVDADPEKWAVNLARSCKNHLGFIGHAQAKNWQPPRVSDMAPLFSALAGGHVDLAKEWVLRLGDQPRQEIEYPAEHAYARMIMALSACPQQWKDVIGQSAEVMSDSGLELMNERAVLGLAMRDDDSRAFFKAFSDAVITREIQTERLARSFTTDWRSFVVERHVWIEGLAWLRLAAVRGWQRDRDFLYCPALALDHRPAPVTNDWVLLPPRKPK